MRAHALSRRALLVKLQQPVPDVESALQLESTRNAIAHRYLFNSQTDARRLYTALARRSEKANCLPWKIRGSPWEVAACKIGPKEALSLVTTGGRAYRVLGVLGQGGFGKVYRARLEGPSGFVKDVAIKVLNENLTPEAVQRFRDEARILGLINDRAVVSAEPPIQLEGRWVLIMDYAEGLSAKDILKQHGPLPPTVALEVVQEVARVLDRVWSHQGPDGEPLHLLHRDIKPGNIQISSAGEARLLDFGIAKATFGSRETETASSIGGTLGYIAPERLEGEEIPAGDVYSLGIVLRELVTGIGPMKRGRKTPRSEFVETPELANVLALARCMYQADPNDRPTAREVEKRCRTLIVKGDELRLREWAESTLPTLAKDQGLSDSLVGTIMDLDPTTMEWTGPEETLPELRSQAGYSRTKAAPTREWWKWGLGLGLGAVVCLLLGVVVVQGGILPLPSRDPPALSPQTSPEDPVATPPKPSAASNQGNPETVPAGVPNSAPPAEALPKSQPIMPATPIKPPVAKPPTNVPETPQDPVVELPPPIKEPEPPPPPTQAIVRVQGDAKRIWLQAPAGNFEPGEIPPGTYQVTVFFDGLRSRSFGQLTLQAGDEVLITCKKLLQTCQW